MYLAAALALLLSTPGLSPPDAGPCTPASTDAIAAAQRRAADADSKASQAESVAVRSGNPGAQARANQARAAATAAQQELARLSCRAADARSSSPALKLPTPRY